MPDKFLPRESAPFRRTRAGNWSHVNDSRPRFERGNAQVYDCNTRDSDFWKACPVCGKECMGEDGLAEHMGAHEP